MAVNGQGAFLTVSEVARLVRRHPVTVRRAIKLGHLHARRPSGGPFIVSRKALEDWTGEDVITQPALQKKLNVKPRTLNNWCEAGEVPFTHIDGVKHRVFDDKGEAAVAEKAAELKERRSATPSSRLDLADSLFLQAKVGQLVVELSRQVAELSRQNTAIERLCEAVEMLLAQRTNGQ